MTTIKTVDPANQLAEVEAGVITADIDGAAAGYGLMYAPDPASYRESTNGGNIATNAGGLRCVKNGVTRDSIAGLEVVLADGQVITTGARTRKNVVDYDLSELCSWARKARSGWSPPPRSGSEPRPTGTMVTFRAAFPSLVTAGRAVIGIAGSPASPEVLELMDWLSVAAVERICPTGLSVEGAAAVLVGQFIGHDAAENGTTAARICRSAGALLVEQTDGDVLLEARRVSGGALSAEGLRVSSDVAVPIAQLAEMFAAIERIGAEEGVAVPTFAHAGDGNLHPSATVSTEDDDARQHAERVLDRISDAALALGGTLSGATLCCASSRARCASSRRRRGSSADTPATSLSSCCPTPRWTRPASWPNAFARRCAARRFRCVSVPVPSRRRCPSVSPSRGRNTATSTRCSQSLIARCTTRSGVAATRWCRRPKATTRRKVRRSISNTSSAATQKANASFESSRRSKTAPQLVSIVGEAGVGKSSLVRRLAGEARLRAGCLVSGQCSEAGNKPPYAPWAEVLTALDSLGIVSAREWHELPRLVPTMSNAALSPESNRYVLLNEIVAYLRLAAETNPVVILLDDMQWSDAESWDALEHVMSQLEMEHVLLCTTMRTEDMRGEALERRNRLLRDERFNEVPLSRLNDADVRQWLAGVFGGEASRELAAYIQRYSEGNPLLATQVVRILLDAGVVRFEHGRWGLWSEPSRELTTALSGLMGRRLDRLSAAARSILNTAAVIGRVFDIDLAVAAGAGTEDEVLEALDQGIEHAVLEATDSSGCEFSFTHGLLVDAVRRSINPRRLARIHERVAAAMEERSPDNASAIAVHYERAGLPLKAYPHAIMAGHQALAMYAQAEARRFFEIAERAAPTPGERATALLGLAEVSELEGRHALTEELCDRALATIADGSDEHTVLALRRMRERTRSLQGQPARETITVCTGLLEKARSLGDRAEESALLTMISHCQDRLGDGAAAERVAREAVAAAQAADDSRLLAESLTRLGSAIKDTNAAEAQDFYGRALTLFHAAGDRSGEARCHINIGKIHQRAGDMAAAEAAYDHGLETAQSAQAVDLAGLASLNLGLLHLRRGQLALAGEHYDDALERFTESSNETDRLSTLFNMAHLAREAEDWTTASVLYEQVMAIAARIGQPDVELGARAGQALAALAVGARSVAEDAMRWIRANVETRPEWWFQGRDLVDALRIRLAAERGDDSHAFRLLSDAVTLAGRHDVYLAAYLVAECAPSLRGAVAPLIGLIDQLLPEVDAFGLTGARQRLANARMSLLASAAA